MSSSTYTYSRVPSLLPPLTMAALPTKTTDAPLRAPGVKWAMGPLPLRVAWVLMIALVTDGARGADLEAPLRDGWAAQAEETPPPQAERGLDGPEPGREAKDDAGGGRSHQLRTPMMRQGGPRGGSAAGAEVPEGTPPNLRAFL